MSKKQLKARDKVVLKMTRDGAVEENLTKGTTEKVSKRLDDAELVKKSDVSTNPEKPKQKRRQKPPKPRDNVSDGQPVQESAAATTPQAETPLIQFDEEVNDEPQPALSETPESAAAPHTPYIPPSALGRNTKSRGSVSDVNTSTEKLSAPSEPKTAPRSEPLGENPKSAMPMDTAAPTPKIERLERKSEKAHQRLDKAREKLPTRKALKKECVFDESTQKGKTRLFFDDEIKPLKESKLKHAVTMPIHKVGASIDNTFHRKISEVEQDNAAVEGAHKTELAAEKVVRHYQHSKNHAVNRQHEKVSKLEHEAEKIDSKLNFEKTVDDHPELKKRGDMNKQYQKQRIKKQQIASRRGGSSQAVEDGVEEIKKGAEKAAEKVKEFIAEHKMMFVWAGIILFFVIIFGTTITSCTSMFVQSGSTFVTSTYLSDDEDMLGAESAYLAMENALRSELDNYAATHTYDEYIFNLDEMYHDPYVLISLLSAKYGGEFTLEDVQGFMEMLFEMQYILTEEVTVETRYRTEIQIEYYPLIDPNTGMIVIDPYTGQPVFYPVEVEVQVPYDYYIVAVTLKNLDLGSLVEGLLDEDQMLLYETYIEGKGNREDLFP